MISSFQNPLVKRIKRLRQKKYRQQEGSFFVEGLRAVLTAVEQNAPIETLVYAPDLLTSAVGQAAIAAQQARGLPCEAVTAEVFGALAERENPTGIGAVVRFRPLTLAELEVTSNSVLLALVEIADPGNLGTILRTVDAAGGNGVILVGATADVGHPTAVKASMGTIFTVPCAQVAAVGELLAWAAEQGLHTCATSVKAQADYRAAVYRRPTLLLLGSEREGLTADVLAAAEQAVSIPMRGTASSLNLAVAAGLLIYEITYQAQQSA